LPVIGAGGSGNYEHLKDAFLTTNVSALACGSLFNFSDSNPIRAKAFLSNHGLSFKVV
jgi:cyclase